ncbi:peptidogalycan biosysnthesis protein, partial [Serratia marcescens]|uniref:peptidogalycan biosysnthesis protein n=4 Tax=Pseudomonadota TaxID=1224 RepID=UPI001953A2AD
LEDAAGTVIGAVPCYLKGHSQGEYVFDHGWADAFERAGGRYYPKLQASIPFTPATGPRLLVHRDWDGPAVRAALANGLRQLTG